MALGCLQDDATTTNDNSNHRRHRILSACGGFLFSRKSVACGALHPFFAKMPHFPLNQIKLPLRQSPSRLVYQINIKLMYLLKKKNLRQIIDLTKNLAPRPLCKRCVSPSVCPSVRAKRGMWSKRVFMRMNGNFSFSVH
jgi:hypothetical protein